MPSKAELKGKVTLNNKVFKSKMRRMKRSVRKFGASMKRIGQMVKRAFIALTAAVTGVAFAFIKLTSMTANYGDEIQKTALKTGLSTEALSELGHVAQISGTNLSTLSKGMKTMARFVSFAEAGLSTYTRELDNMGLRYEDIANKTPIDTFDTFISALRNMDNELKQSAAAQVVFGRAGQELLPMIKDTGVNISRLREEAHELGIVMSQEAANASARWKDETQRLKSALAGIRNKLVLAFIDQFSGGIEGIKNKIIEFRKENKFTDWVATAALSVNNFVSQSRQLFAQFVSVVSPLFKILSREVSLVFDGLKLIGRLAFQGLLTSINVVVAEIKKSFIGLKTTLQIVWNLIKEAGKLAFNGVLWVAIKAFSNILQTAEMSINKVIEALNKLPKVDIDPVNLETIDKAEAKLKELENKMKASVDAVKIGGDAFKPLEEGAAEIERIERERVGTQSAINQRMNEQVGTIEALLARIKENKKALAEGKDITEAQQKLVEKEAKIREQHARIQQKITTWQERAASSENKKNKQTEKNLKTQKNITEELDKQSGIPLRGILATAGGKILNMTQPKNRMVNNRGNETEQKQLSLAEKQLKEQQLINSNLTRNKPQLAW